MSRPIQPPTSASTRALLGVAALFVVAVVLAAVVLGDDDTTAADEPVVDPLWDPAHIPGPEHETLGHLVPLFERAAAESDVDPDLLKAVAWRESHWRADAISQVGAMGIAQLMPVTAEHVATTFLSEPDLDPFDPEANLRMAAAYLAWLLDRYEGDEARALTAYVQGHASIERDGPGADALGYAEDVLLLAGR